MALLTEKFNKITQGAFEYLKVAGADVSLTEKSVTFHLIYPQEFEEKVRVARDKITRAITEAAGLKIAVKTDIKRSHFDFDFFRGELMAFVNKFPSLASTLEDKDVCCKNCDGKYVICFTLADPVYDYCKQFKVDEQIQQFASARFCESIGVQIERGGELSGVDFAVVLPEEDYEYDDPAAGRSIRPQNVEEFIGNIVYDQAGYIEDATSPKEVCVLCGTLGRINEIERKKKEETDLVKYLYKFELSDYTGTMPCVFFPSQKNRDQFLMLKPGKQIVARGKLELDEFRGGGAMNYRVRDISLCTLPENFKVNRLRRKVPARYKTVFPAPYIVKNQASLFDSGEQTCTHPFLKGKTFCVFDLETTGFNPDSDSIIEIGAVKICDGMLSETFSTLVDPKIPLPEKIIKITHIEDRMLRGQPFLDDVMPDFYKFISGTVMVGQNVQFDYGFISSKGKAYKMYFDNEMFDTLALARKYLPGLRKYSLDALVKHFGIDNDNAHRALSDAVATAKVFIELVKNFEKNT